MYKKYNNKFSKAKNWLNGRRLPLNFKVTKKKMANAFRVKLPYKDGSEYTSQKKNCIKYLGVLIDDTISWKYHISYVSSRISENIDSALPLLNLLELLTLQDIFTLRLLQFSHQRHKKRLPSSSTITFVTPVMFTHLTLDMRQKLTSIKHVLGLILEKQLGQL